MQAKDVRKFFSVQFFGKPSCFDVLTVTEENDAWKLIARK